jgi:Fe2+ transport system protein FeoA
MNAPLPIHRTLDQLPLGTRCRVLSVAGAHAIRRRLLEMGLCTGIDVDVLRRAPLGDPIEVRLRGYLLSLRSDQAALVRVEPLAVGEAG